MICSVDAESSRSLCTKGWSCNGTTKRKSGKHSVRLPATWSLLLTTWFNARYTRHILLTGSPGGNDYTLHDMNPNYILLPDYWYLRSGNGAATVNCTHKLKVQQSWRHTGNSHSPRWRTITSPAPPFSFTVLNKNKTKQLFFFQLYCPDSNNSLGKINLHWTLCNILGIRLPCSGKTVLKCFKRHTSFFFWTVFLGMHPSSIHSEASRRMGGK